MPRSKVLTFDSLKKFLSKDISNDVKKNPSITGSEVIQKIVNYLDELEKSSIASTLPASMLNTQDAIRTFGLEEDISKKGWSLASSELFEVPNSLSLQIEKLNYVMDTWGGNEASSRIMINAVLIEALAIEKRAALGAININDRPTFFQSVLPGSSTPPKAVICADNPIPAPLVLRTEVELKMLVNYRNEQRLLSGVADYSIWYDVKEPYGTNLIIVEAKKPGTTGLAEGQLLSYMGVVHQTRNLQKKRNTTVYGVATDGDYFQFYRIDNKSILTSGSILRWKYPDDAKEILSRFRLIIRAAILSTPTTSPIKEGQRREVMLSCFDDNELQRKFDFNVREVDLDNLPEDIEIVDI